ncbi:MAG: AI-2E family transporter [Chloroflexota bacterium]|jgi:predicted PurR-regulated permease PerM
MNHNVGQLSPTTKFFLTIALIAITLFFMNSVSSLINSVILSAIIVVSATPLLYGLQRKGLHPILAYAVTLVLIFVVFIAIVIFVILAINQFIGAVPQYAAELEDAINSIIEFIRSLGVSEEIDLAAITQILEPGKLLGFIVNFFAGLVGGLSDIFLVALIVIFLLVDALGVPGKIAPYIQDGDRTVSRISTFGADVRRYVVVTTIVGLATGILDTIFFIMMGVDFPVLWGALAFFMSYIPTLGFWIALIPPVLLALLESGPAVAFIVFIGIVIINGFAENVVKPKYMGDELDLSPFTVVFSVVFWSAVLGPLGAILSVPITMAVKSLILEPDESNRWLADLMSAEPHQQMLEEESAEPESEVAEEGI